MSIQLTKVDQHENPIPSQVYILEPETFQQDLLEHPDFQVPDQTNISITTYERTENGIPVEIIRCKEGEFSYSQLIGHLDTLPEPQPE